MGDVSKRFGQMEVDEKPLEIVPWPKEEECKVVTDFLNEIDPGFSIKIRSWGLFKSKMSIVHESMDTHMRHYEHLNEINNFDDSNFKACRNFGDALRTLNTKKILLSDVVLRPMDPLVTHPGRLGHFLLPEKTRGFIAEKNVSFEKLNMELPK